MGSVYGLVALGYTMVYGILKLINFAHGDVYMLGAYFGFFFAHKLGFAETPSLFGIVVVLILSMISCGIVGFLIYRLASSTFVPISRINLLITSSFVSRL